MDTPMTQDTGTRWRFLVDNPALKNPGWLPAAEDVPELADLRAEHDRLLALQREAVTESLALRAQRDGEEEARRAAQESEFLGRSEIGELPPITVTDEDLLDARVRADAAKDAFQTFTKQAIAQVREREVGLREQMLKVRAEAAEKEALAETLLSEAATLKASTLRLDAWLNRTVGKDPLGYVAWTDLPAPVPQRPMTMAEIHEATVPAWGSVDLDSSDASQEQSFGTDDPANLDPDSAAAKPWEVVIHD